ncbi:hypothetical protein [Streptomyces sp. 5-10]|uniref:hypothetical protein n=1 Tax=Streptomyces sp. 5-10 TaxID=878925 RepID=UPI00168A5A4B|nr:hypothetical protein [Streptomyces sp. 5-10]MBD3004887.1 hypothetical protein [Streptomyces sp. 5-10]
MTHSPTGLKPPCGVVAYPAPEGGWRTVVQWDYDFRYEEIRHFVVSRKRCGQDEWELVAENVDNDERMYVDTLPDEGEYAYCVAAVPRDGGDPLKAFSEVIQEGFNGDAPVFAYTSASPDTVKPSGIHKPIRSLAEAVYVAWDIQPQASAYLLEAVDETGDAYMEVTVTNPDTPVGLLVGSHPSRFFTARVSVLRSRPDGTLYPAASAEQRIELDDAPRPHLGVVEFRYDPDAGLSYGAVLALTGLEGGLPFLCVNGAEQVSAWTLLGHIGSAAMVDYVTQGRSGVSAALATPPASNIRSGR